MNIVFMHLIFYSCLAKLNSEEDFLCFISETYSMYRILKPILVLLQCNIHGNYM